MPLERNRNFNHCELDGGLTFDRTQEWASHQTAFPVDTSAEIAAFVDKYQRTRRVIPVSFRELVPWLKVGERATHYLHPYPAKLLPHIAHFFLASRSMCPADGLVLDPFGGSGTVALETCLSGRPAAYADTNPLARLITETKICLPGNLDFDAALASLASRFQRSRTLRHPAVVNVQKWFRPEVSGYSTQRVDRLLSVGGRRSTRRNHVPEAAARAENFGVAIAAMERVENDCHRRVRARCSR